MGLRRVDHHHYTLKTLTLPSTGQWLMDKTVGDAADPNTAQGRSWLSSDGLRLSLSRVIHSLYGHKLCLSKAKIVSRLVTVKV